MKIVLSIVLFFFFASCNQSPTPKVMVDNPYAPLKSDNDLILSPAFLEKAVWIVEEHRLNLKGSLPTPCNQLRVSYTQSKNKLEFEIYSLSNPELICAQMVQPFDVDLFIKDYPQRGINIIVNGHEVNYP
ncbi:MAG: hypothetical protein FJZ98_09755 [Chloroflexi bacterium]|nr:hypothetical protein [Chloroflexota bacterium]